MDYKIKIKNINESCEIIKINKDAQIFASALIAQNFSKNDLVFIAKNDLEIEKFKEQIIFFAPNLSQNYEILTFYAWDCSPYQKSSPKQSISTNRIKTLYQLANKNEKKTILITSINAILQKIIPQKLIKNSSLIVKTGDKISISQITNFLVFNGYERRSTAYTNSEFALRGGIIDIIISQAATLVGYRFDFLGDEIESIKEFDPISQLSLQKVKQIEILPASEVVLNDETIANFRKKYRDNFAQNFNLNHEDSLYEAISSKRHYQGMEHYLPLFYEEELTNIFSYLQNPVIFFNKEIKTLAKNRHQEILNSYDLQLQELNQKYDSKIYNPLKPELLYFSENDFCEIINDKINIIFNDFESENQNSRIIDLEIKPVPDFFLASKTNKKDPILLFEEYIKAFEKDKKIFIAAINENSKERIEKLLKDYELYRPVCIVYLNSGFQSQDLIMVSEQAIFGEKIIRKKSLKNQEASKRILEESLTINIGELIVHRDYGIGQFDGIHKIKAGEVENDMVKIIYGGGDILFISVEDINLITRYGASNPLIQLDKLGVSAWKNRKNKVKNRIKIAAEQLIKIAAERQVKKAPIFIPNQHFYLEFKSCFEYLETQDQINAIEEIEKDLEKGAPMDRLICGDVGFGKTEVAMRAAFITASSNYDYEISQDQENPEIIRKTNIHQVAIITPTTLLCRQHYQNFVKRFENTNIKIAQLSRLTSQTQNKKTKEKIENGEIDIVIGTHSLLAKNMKFKNLSLLIVDEEQHFGVAQKERLKEMRSEIHILTLSATPIPRTLQMSLTGVKDLSLIATPPIDRLAVRNFVMNYDNKIAKEAIMREYQRFGKVFFVTPRVKYIAELEDKLRKILPPEIRVQHAHGQMKPSELDKIMNEFHDNKIDVLLSTTIIESGIDIANANTIIIHKAEMFGLSQLYQLRGRVGRGKIRGYAYFMTSDKILNEEAKKKLEVMQHLDDLGVGFSIASHDMDIRGSGDILGDEQSGHIKETGVELYQEMLLTEIQKQKNTILNKNQSEIEEEIDFDFEFNPQIKLGISLSIPQNYIEDLSLRMSFYKKIAALKNDDEKITLENEIFDRFGKIPQETKNLMEIAVLKQQCKKLKIQKIEKRKDGILIDFVNNSQKNPQKILAMILQNNNEIKLCGENKLLFLNLNLNQDIITQSFKILQKLNSVV